MSGFRVAYGGAQELYGVKPDLTTLGKIIGGGLPIGAYGGSAEIMKLIAPCGDVYQAGTLSGNPIATASGISTLEMLKPTGFYDTLNDKASLLETGLIEAANDAGIPIEVNRVGSMLTVFFTDKPVTDFASACETDTKRFAAFWKEMLVGGVYLPPSAYEAWFVSSAHTNREIVRTIHTAAAAFKNI